jgi:predicted DNA-binding transcriptional regulator YafY
MTDSIPPAVRLLRAYRLMLQRGRMATSAIARELGVDKRRALRWMQDLAEEVDIRPQGEAHDRTWILDPAHVSDNLGWIDAISLHLGHGLTAFLEGAGLASAYDRLHPEERLPPAVHGSLGRKFYCHDEPARILGPAREWLDVVIDALFKDRSLRLRYAGSRGERSYAAFQPYTLVLYRRGLYLLGRAHADAPDITRLAVDRLLDAALGPAFPYPADWDPAAVLADTFGIWAEGGPELIVLRFRADRAALATTRTWHPSQSFHPLPDGRVELRMRASGRELVRWVLEWGPTCEVVQPAWLRDAVITELKGALALYEPNPQPTKE